MAVIERMVKLSEFSISPPRGADRKFISMAGNPPTLDGPGALPTASRRYGRLPTCATSWIDESCAHFILSGNFF
jgi:hypothetical protein